MGINKQKFITEKDQQNLSKTFMSKALKIDVCIGNISLKKKNKTQIYNIRKHNNHIISLSSIFL